MPEARTFASLSPTLLARKGTAKPAMRPQLQPLEQFAASHAAMIDGAEDDDRSDDLGWNDMGEPHQADAAFPETDPVETATVLPFGAGESGFAAQPLTTGIPEVVRRQDALAGKIVAGKVAARKTAGEKLAVEKRANARAMSAKVANGRVETLAGPTGLATHRWSQTDPASGRRSALAEGRRAAFTLRVDGDRHLKLRLACTVEGRSAQQLVTEALDRLLAELPELDDLARRVKRR